MHYEPKNYTIPAIDGISQKTIETHLGLYRGYVTNLNAHYEKIAEVCKDGSDTAIISSALTRRISFELAGVKNHELYFDTLVGGSAPLTEGSALHARIIKQFGTFEMFADCLKKTALSMRGIGWAFALYDKEKDMIHFVWVSDHELGNVNLPAIAAVDMWEHAYMIDHAPAEKETYVTAYLNAINWQVIEKRFDTL